jgi:hypothetical protein
MKKLIPILVLCISFPATLLAQTVLINEVDADQSGTDAAEFVELFDGGSGNTDLTGMSIVLYNGSDVASYQAFDLDGYYTDANGYFVLCGDAANVPNCTLDVDPGTNLIQNGADAVALITGNAVDFPEDTPLTTDNLLDAIVYDTDDDDNTGLLALLNAGQPQVNERDGGDGTAHSNQRSPNGSGGARNTDTYTQDIPTPGAANAGATPVVIVINEVDADQSGTDAAEFVELYDGGAGNTDLTGLSIIFVNGSDDASYEAYDLDGLSTDADGYFVLCGNPAIVPNCTMDAGKLTNLVQNGADGVALITGDAADFPVDTPVASVIALLVDAVVYDTNDDDDDGILGLLNVGQPQVNIDGAGDKDSHSIQRSPNGSGGLRNTDSYTWGLPTPGSVNVPSGVANETDGALPSSITLEQNFPNPFNPTTLISYSLPQSQYVRLSVIDMLGRQVAELVNRVQTVGEHQITFDAVDLSSGIYIYRLDAGAESVTKKMILLK